MYGAWKSQRISNKIRKMNELKPASKNKRTLCWYSIHMRYECKCECEVVTTKQETSKRDDCTVKMAPKTQTNSQEQMQIFTIRMQPSKFSLSLERSSLLYVLMRFPFTDATKSRWIYIYISFSSITLVLVFSLQFCALLHNSLHQAFCIIFN